jgi:hypothetical protein
LTSGTDRNVFGSSIYTIYITETLYGFLEVKGAAKDNTQQGYNKEPFTIMVRRPQAFIPVYI